LAAPVPVQDLLFRAKDLFIAANVAGIHRTEIDRTATVGPGPTHRYRVQGVPRALFPAFRGRPSVPAILTIHFALRRDIGAIRTIPKRDGRRRHGSKANAAGGLTNAAAPSGA